MSGGDEVRCEDCRRKDYRIAELEKALRMIGAAAESASVTRSVISSDKDALRSVG